MREHSIIFIFHFAHFHSYNFKTLHTNLSSWQSIQSDKAVTNARRVRWMLKAYDHGVEMFKRPKFAKLVNAALVLAFQQPGNTRKTFDIKEKVLRSKGSRNIGGFSAPAQLYHADCKKFNSHIRNFPDKVNNGYLSAPYSAFLSIDKFTTILLADVEGNSIINEERVNIYPMHLLLISGNKLHAGDKFMGADHRDSNNDFVYHYRWFYDIDHPDYKGEDIDQQFYIHGKGAVTKSVANRYKAKENFDDVSWPEPL